MTTSVSVRAEGRVTIVTIERPEKRNAVDLPTARALYDAFRRFDADTGADVAVLTGAGGAFCAGADLKALAAGETGRFEETGDFGPMGPTRLRLGKPVIAAIEGPAVAGGTELALWCDLRIAARSAVFGVFNRRFGVPLIDLGTIRLPRIVGHGRAMELILTGRAVSAEEALRIGLANEVTDDGEALARALALAQTLSGFPQNAMRNDRLSAIEQWDLGGEAAVANEVAKGLATLASGEAAEGPARFAGGAGRHGRFAGVRKLQDSASSPRRRQPLLVTAASIASALAAHEDQLVLKRVPGEVRSAFLEWTLEQVEFVNIENSGTILASGGHVFDDVVLASPRHHVRLIAGEALVESVLKFIDRGPLVMLDRLRSRPTAGATDGDWSRRKQGRGLVAVRSQSRDNSAIPAAIANPRMARKTKERVPLALGARQAAPRVAAVAVEARAGLRRASGRGRSSRAAAGSSRAARRRSSSSSWERAS